MVLRAPFPWFGGKSLVADVAWHAFGNVPNYVEPFFGSGAVLLGRPHEAKIETINDKDCYLANFWRAVTQAPDEVAAWSDWPVNEADLHARHRRLLELLPEHRERMKSDPDYFDAKLAAWWVWGISMWIGGGWCSETHRNARGRQRPDLEGDGQGVHKRPNVRTGGQGIHRRLLSEKVPNLSTHSGRGAGVHRKIPDLYARGYGRGIRAADSVTNQIPSLIGAGRGITAPTSPPCLEWFRALQARLRRVRVCCGDWKRVMGNSVLGTTRTRNSGMNPCAVFLDPPYPDGDRAPEIYATDDGKVWDDAADWAIEHGDDPDLRIALCGYEGGRAMPSSWTCFAWKSRRGYAREDNGNKHRERIWFSPHCLPLKATQPSLFGASA